MVNQRVLLSMLWALTSIMLLSTILFFVLMPHSRSHNKQLFHRLDEYEGTAESSVEILSKLDAWVYEQLHRLNVSKIIMRNKKHKVSVVIGGDSLLQCSITKPLIGRYMSHDLCHCVQKAVMKVYRITHIYCPKQTKAKDLPVVKIMQKRRKDVELMNTVLASTSRANRSCTMKERLHHVNTQCVNMQTPAFDDLTDEQLGKTFGLDGFLVDEKHKVLACLHFKVGSSTWRLIFANNSAEKPITGQKAKTIFNKVVFFEDYGIYRLSHERYSKEDVRNILKTYYKFMVVRHPFVRLVSTYTDKFKRKNKWFADLHGKDIVAKYRPDASRVLKQTGQGINFEDLLRYIDGGGSDGHWQGPYNDWCQPCVLDYDEIVRIETHNTDAASIVNNHLAGRGAATSANRKHKVNLAFATELPDYKRVDDELFEATLKHYRLDLEQFGYHYERKADRSVLTDCAIETESGEVCC